MHGSPNEKPRRDMVVTAASTGFAPVERDEQAGPADAAGTATSSQEAFL